MDLTLLGYRALALSPIWLGLGLELDVRVRGHLYLHFVVLFIQRETKHTTTTTIQLDSFEHLDDATHVLMIISRV